MITEPEAPFPRHMYLFHADGTVVQSNPEAGHAQTSDSNLMGVWVPEGDRFKGKVVEILADRATRKFVGHGELAFSLKVDGNALRGTAIWQAFDVDGKRVDGPSPSTMTGQRVIP